MPPASEEVPKRFEEIIHSCFQRNPADRYNFETIVEILQDLLDINSFQKTSNPPILERTLSIHDGKRESRELKTKSDRKQSFLGTFRDFPKGKLRNQEASKPLDGANTINMGKNPLAKMKAVPRSQTQNIQVSLPKPTSEFTNIFNLKRSIRLNESSDSQDVFTSICKGNRSLFLGSTGRFLHLPSIHYFSFFVLFFFSFLPIFFFILSIFLFYFFLVFLSIFYFIHFWFFFLFFF